jgi:hypothetical protein
MLAMRGIPPLLAVSSTALVTAAATVPQVMALSTATTM